MKISVTVTLKKDVLDPQGKVVKQTLKNMGHENIENVRQGKYFEIDLDETVFAELLLDVGGQHLRSRVTREAVEELMLHEGQQVFALIKSVAFEGRLLIN